MERRDALEDDTEFSKKWAFVAKSSMTYAQIVATGAIATQLFREFPGLWKGVFVATMLFLTLLAIIVYPNDKKGGT